MKTHPAESGSHRMPILFQTSAGSDKADNWKEQVDKVMQEIQRVLRPNGTIILFETLGTSRLLFLSSSPLVSSD